MGNYNLLGIFYFNLIFPWMNLGFACLMCVCVCMYMYVYSLQKYVAARNGGSSLINNSLERGEK